MNGRGPREEQNRLPFGFPLKRTKRGGKYLLKTRNPPIWPSVNTNGTILRYFKIGAPPILVYFSVDWDVHWGYGVLTHSHLLWGQKLLKRPPRLPKKSKTKEMSRFSRLRPEARTARERAWSGGPRRDMGELFQKRTRAIFIGGGVSTLMHFAWILGL